MWELYGFLIRSLDRFSLTCRNFYRGILLSPFLRDLIHIVRLISIRSLRSLEGSLLALTIRSLDPN